MKSFLLEFFLAICFSSVPAFPPCLADSSNGSSKENAGYHLYRDDVPDIPWSIQVLKIDRSNTNLQLHTIFGDGKSIGLIPLPDQMRQLPPELGRPIAAINGDYYLDRAPYIGDPKGVQICRGELISSPCNWTCLWVDPRGTPHMDRVTTRFSVTWPNGDSTPIGLNEARPPSKCVLYTEAIGPTTRTRGGIELILERGSTGKWLPLAIGEDYNAVVKEVRTAGDSQTAPDTMILSIGTTASRKIPKIKKGDVIRLNTDSAPTLEGATTAISGGPALIRNGKIEVGWSAIRHPRSAVGWNKEFIYLVQVDGRQGGHSVGMTYSEIAEYMEKLGCDEAMNLDGGGSSTFWALGQVVNSPSEGQPRGVANALVLVQKNP